VNGAKPPEPETEVYSADEIARAAGVRPGDIRDMARAGVLKSLDGRFFASADAIVAVRSLAGTTTGDRSLFRPVSYARLAPGFPVAGSGGVHAAVLGAIVLATTFGLTKPQAHIAAVEHQDLGLVYLISPGPGGGGGGGGHQEPAPPPRAERNDAHFLHSPLPMRKPPAVVDPAPIRRVDPPKPEPQVVAPIVSESNDPRNRAGIPWTPAPPAPVPDSYGPGTAGGTGTGQGSGVGDGQGAGVGPGSGGGTGGGPYRPGSGITAPSIQREIKPDYTEEGRRRNIEGDVVLEIVVRSDGTVGSVKLLRGLGSGLDERAIDAVRQWRFNPAHRYGTPVDVIVEVAVEFKLR
jgi:TonB family protein